VDERWFRRAGGFAWLMVGLPMVLQPAGTPWRLGVWLAAYLVFAVAFLRPAPIVWALQGLCVAAMVAVLCNGFEGTLLVLVAMQLARRYAPRVGLTWIALQTALFAAGIGAHWSPRSALLLAPPYLGLQVLGYAVVRLLGRVAGLARVRERLRIALELHDALGHHLTALSLNLEAAAHQVSEPAVGPVRTAQAIARLLLSEVRDVVSDLGSPDDVAVALRRLAAGMPTPKVHLSVDLPLARPRGDGGDGGDGAHALLRCAQEIMTNAARHARAENLWIDVSAHDQNVELRARDDGIGAAEVQPGGGLGGMRARLESLGGTLSIESQPGSGFHVVATVPW
jgi:signal transduction histidine kinase